MVNYKHALFAALNLVSGYVVAQKGCTDPYAQNYNPAAKESDGSCIYAPTRVYPVLKGKMNSAITESSGVVYTSDKLWTHNDSGNPPNIFSIDTATGKTLQTVFIDNYPNTDWEDITADGSYIYVEDAGNNNGTRKDLKILKVKKADIGNGSVVHVNAEAISFSYNDQTSFVSSNINNFDCESVISIRDSLYIFTKDRGDSNTRVYHLPKTPGNYNISPIMSFHARGLVTGADYDSVKKELVLIGYEKNHVNSFIWIFNNFNNDSFFTGNKRLIEIGSGGIWQTEGICYNGSGKFFISCETDGLDSASLFEITSRAWQPKLASIDNDRNSSNMKVYPNPAQNFIYIENDLPINKVSIQNQLGQTLYSENVENEKFVIETNQFRHKAGIYYLVVYTATDRYLQKVVIE